MKAFESRGRKPRHALENETPAARFASEGRSPLGGLSGCTFEEAQSWGKISEGADKVTVYCDSTIALPLLDTAIAQAKHDLRFRRIPPRMEELWASPKKKRREGTNPR